jgi:hypothetical protein
LYIRGLPKSLVQGQIARRQRQQLCAIAGRDNLKLSRALDQILAIKSGRIARALDVRLRCRGLSVGPACRFPDSPFKLLAIHRQQAGNLAFQIVLRDEDPAILERPFSRRLTVRGKCR